MGARDIHIAKYILPYQALYPAAQILLVKCEMKHFLNRKSAYREAMTAAPAIRAAIDASDPAPQLAIHVFSNGGATMLRHLYRAYRETASPGEAAVLPLHTTIMDSVAGRVQLQPVDSRNDGGDADMDEVADRTLLRLWILSYVLWFLLPVPDPLARLALSHNKPENVKEVRRTYIYSKEDELVMWQSVEKYANDAKQKGFVVRLERFSGSAHVAHLRLDGDRYWKTVEETWEGTD